MECLGNIDLQKLPKTALLCSQEKLNHLLKQKRIFFNNYASGISGSTSFFNFSSDSCHPK
jgi:hypothetical protein